MNHDDALNLAADLIHDHARNATREAIRIHLAAHTRAFIDDDIDFVAELIATATVTVEWPEDQS